MNVNKKSEKLSKDGCIDSFRKMRLLKTKKKHALNRNRQGINEAISLIIKVELVFIFIWKYANIQNFL